MGLNFLSQSNVTASKSELRQTNFTAALSEEKSHETEREREREGRDRVIEGVCVCVCEGWG